MIMGQRKAWESASFTALVEHFNAFSAKARRELAQRYGAQDEAARALALWVCLNPDTLRDAATRELSSTQARTLLEDLVLDHDLPVRVDWAERKLVKKMALLGLLPPTRGRLMMGMGSEVVLPGALAAIMASAVENVRPSLPILLGKLERAPLMELARAHGVDEGPEIAVILELRDHFAQEETLEGIVDALPEPEWLGGALMAIELGGMCYWQEVFGTGVEDAGQKIVPLMRDFERRQEQDIAQTLLGWGVIFKFEAPQSEYEMLAVPEELWKPMWSMGRGWLMEWVTHTFAALQENGARRLRTALPGDVQTDLKWLCCERSLHPFPFPLPPEVHARLQETAPSGLSLDVLAGFADELGVFDVPADELPEDLVGFLDSGRTSFARDFMLEWCLGGVGSESEAFIPAAIGLDEGWREQVSELDLEEALPFLPAWLEHEGIDAQMTGTGYLRALSASTPELLMLELGLVNSYIWSFKILWLDVLSMLEDGRWYPMSLLQELLQLCAALTLFNHLSHVLEQPGLSHYVPVQRASFLSDPAHVQAFNAWCEAIVEQVMVPLGVAQREDHLVMLATRSLRVESPEGMPDELRVESMRELFGEDELDFDLSRTHEGARLFSVAAVHDTEQTPQGEWVSLGQPLLGVLAQLKGRRIVKYEDAKILVAP